MSENFLNKDHEEFVLTYGSDFLEKLIEKEVENVETSGFNGQPYVIDGNISASYEDEERDLIWYFDIEVSFEDVRLSSFEKEDLTMAA